MRFTALLFSLSLPLNALTIQIDYSLDSNNFFSASGNPQGSAGATKARAALEAAAARWSAIINHSLPEVTAIDHPSKDIRLSFPDPSNFSVEEPVIEYDEDGNPIPIDDQQPIRSFEFYEIGSAQSASTDSLYVIGGHVTGRPAANQYKNGITIPENTFIIYVGGRPLSSDAFTGAFLGNNYEDVANDPNSIFNRGFNEGISSLPVWGSSISFNSEEDANNNRSILERKWHFDHTTAVSSGAKDFYSVALAEIGKALGVGLLFDDWKQLRSDSETQFIGNNTLNAYIEEHGIQTTRLNLQGPEYRYFARAVYKSKIFSGGDPNYVDTVGPGVDQAVIFEAQPAPDPGAPPEQFIPGIIHGKRFEITNMDVAAIRDLGWSTISAAPVNDVTFVTLDRSLLTGTVTLTFPTEPEASYTIQTSTNNSDWQNVTPDLPSEGTSTDWTDGEAGYIDPLGSSFARRKKFYRVLKND